MIKSAVKRILSLAGYRLRPIAICSRGPTEILFLHIGKNAGTQIIRLSEQIQKHAGIRIVKLGHDIAYTTLAPNSRYFFSIREPASRFVSAFYSRQRNGQPRGTPTDPHKALSFSRFEHANDLAENLFNSGASGREAIGAMQSIYHASMHQIDWFRGAGHFLAIHPPLWIVRQEHFDRDFEQFLRRANIDVEYRDLIVAADSKNAHRNDYSYAPELSNLAIENLKRWYARDYAFYDMCELWLQEKESN